MLEKLVLAADRDLDGTLDRKELSSQAGNIFVATIWAAARTAAVCNLIGKIDRLSGQRPRIRPGTVGRYASETL